jgi:Ca2+-transporting ATPase
MIQGILIFIVSFGTYYIVLNQNPENVLIARTMGIGILILANLLLVQVNSSNTRSAIETIRYYIKDKMVTIMNFIMIAGLLLIIYTPINSFLKLTSLNIIYVLTIIIIAIISVIWYEIIKLLRKK